MIITHPHGSRNLPLVSMISRGRIVQNTSNGAVRKAFYPSDGFQQKIEVISSHIYMKTIYIKNSLHHVRLYIRESRIYLFLCEFFFYFFALVCKITFVNMGFFPDRGWYCITRWCMLMIFFCTKLMLVRVTIRPIKKNK